MTISLLEKTRAIGNVLHNSTNSTIELDKMAQVLAEIIGGNVYIVGGNGQLLGIDFYQDWDCFAEGRKQLTGQMISPEFNRMVLEFNKTVVNIKQTDQSCILTGEPCNFKQRMLALVPIICGGKRQGSIILAREMPFTEDDVLLGEYGANIIGIEVLQNKTAISEAESRKRSTVQVAFTSLSYSEKKAIPPIFQEFEGNEGVLVASKLADRIGVTRSVVVNALRKFESAGVIETKSLGMKGTYIRILNDNLREEIEHEWV